MLAIPGIGMLGFERKSCREERFMRRTGSIGLTMFAVILLSGTAYGRGAICGDVDSDGFVTATDATIVNQFLAGLAPQQATTACNGAGILQCGDVNQDGAV